ncbi:hypothetical protein CONPUDRAFT_83161 [Coniophora puteana RWD-64-598 SS2]|uniref:Uncharacterized protein n=1 Tax=Coniophora puteana (strain RWD-64-598) TaxID=741705 RepID=A0A5M3ML11_CONPW|nr:uncharacterized protein CONPUDRAFT_83161 [Coniophora puteana RWD-64-598 SS2]EIW79929.1 hypothetical protein CONPUDRAFT_83161 [Coniophora puteana RWD-64-598 SS2]
MADTVAEVDAGICGCCCICCESALWTWCNTKAFGSNDLCDGQRGWCTSCFEKSFDRDRFEEAVKTQQDREQRENGGALQPVTDQPTSSMMSISTNSSGEKTSLDTCAPGRSTLTLADEEPVKV